MFPTHRRDSGKANGERPAGEAHSRQNVWWKAAQLPRQYRREEKKNSDLEPRCQKQVPIAAAEAAHIEVERAHGGEHRVHSPRRIGLAKPERVSRSKEQQKNRCDAVEHRRFHRLASGDYGKSTPAKP